VGEYAQICVNDFVAGGWRNTSATTLTDATLHTDATENIRTSESLISHQMAHQWFGDPSDVQGLERHLLNEGFATYYQSAYDGHKNGRDSMLYGLYQNARTINHPDERRQRHRAAADDDPQEMFRYLSVSQGRVGAAHAAVAIGEDPLSPLHQDLRRTASIRQRGD